MSKIVLKELEEALARASSAIGRGETRTYRELTISKDLGGTFNVSFDILGDKWTEVETWTNTPTEITSYGHLMPEQVIVAKILPLLKEWLLSIKVSLEEIRLSKIASLKSERDKINKELKSLSSHRSGNEDT